MTTSAIEPVQRLVYLDWLRIFATLMLIPFHALEAFGYRTFYNKAPDLGYAYEAAAQTIALWHMPLLFLIAGAASYFTFKNKSHRQFLITRARRLLVPFLFSVFTVLPITGYLSDNPRYGINHQSFWDYYPRFFRFHWDGIGGFSGTFTPGHLWFLLYLFMFSIIGTYLLRAFESGRAKNSIDKFAELLNRFPLLIFLSALPLSVTRATWPFYPYPAYYLCFFLFGYLLFASKPLASTLRKSFWPAAVLIIVLTPILLQQYVRGSFDPTPNFTMFPFATIAERVLVELTAISWLILIYELARLFVTRETPLIRYLSEASIAIYVIHLTIVVAFSRLFIGLGYSNIISLIFIVLSSVIATGIIYEIFIRRWNMVRILFGMKTRRQHDDTYLPKEHGSTEKVHDSLRG